MAGSAAGADNATLGDVTQSSGMMDVEPWAWTGSWAGSADNPSAASAISAISHAIGTASACAARARAPRNASAQHVQPAMFNQRAKDIHNTTLDSGKHSIY